MSTIEQLREAFPLLVWSPPGRDYIGRMGAEPEKPSRWRIVVGADLSAAVIEGKLRATWEGMPVALGPDPIADLRTIIEAEGIRLAKESDQLAEAARLLGGQPQSDWRAAMAEDSASHMARELAEARARIAEFEKLDAVPLS